MNPCKHLDVATRTWTWDLRVAMAEHHASDVLLNGRPVRRGKRTPEPLIDDLVPVVRREPDKKLGEIVRGMHPSDRLFWTGMDGVQDVDMPKCKQGYPRFTMTSAPGSPLLAQLWRGPDPCAGPQVTRRMVWEFRAPMAESRTRQVQFTWPPDSGNSQPAPVFPPGR